MAQSKKNDRNRVIIYFVDQTSHGTLLICNATEKIDERNFGETGIFNGDKSHAGNPPRVVETSEDTFSTGGAVRDGNRYADKNEIDMGKRGFVFNQFVITF